MEKQSGFGEMVLRTGIADDGTVTAIRQAGGAPPSQVLRGTGGAPPTIAFSWQDQIYGPQSSALGDWAAASASVPVGWAVVRNGQVIVNATTPNYQYPGQSQTSNLLVTGSATDVADNGWVVFTAEWGGHQGGPVNELFTWHNGTIAPVPGSQGVGTATIPAVNDAGVVAALVQSPSPSTTPQRLVVYHGGVEGTVLSQGDALFGSTVSRMSFLPGGFNNAEQLGLLVGLADGRDVVVIATVPEPAALTLLCLPALFALRRRRT